MSMSEVDRIICAFSKSANLYSDVLNIDQNADSSEILRAYHIQWQNLKSALNSAETEFDKEVEKRKLDALHSTYKILSNSLHRSKYNNLLDEVHQEEIEPLEPPSSTLEDLNLKLKSSDVYRSNKVFRRTQVEFSPRSVLGANEASNTKIDCDDTYNDSIELSFVDYSYDESIEEYGDDSLDLTFDILDRELQTEQALIKYNPILRCVPISYKKKARRAINEMYVDLEGTKEDSLSAFDQVWNVFAIQPDELDGLVGVINKEKESFYKIDEFYENLQKRLLSNVKRFEV